MAGMSDPGTPEPVRTLGGVRVICGFDSFAFGTIRDAPSPSCACAGTIDPSAATTATIKNFICLAPYALFGSCCPGSLKYGPLPISLKGDKAGILPYERILPRFLNDILVSVFTTD